MSYYNLCGIGSQHSNIAKGKGGEGTYKNHFTGRSVRHQREVGRLLGEVNCD
jgi:hypothetical protein